MADDITIAALSPGDQAAWAPLWRAYLAFYKTELPAAQFDLTFTRYTDPNRTDMQAWLAWHGAEAVGLVHAISHAHGWRAEPVTYLQDLYTARQARGRGVGRALIETVYADAEAAARPHVYWLTQQGNQTARRLYDQLAEATDFIKYVQV